MGKSLIRRSQESAKNQAEKRRKKAMENKALAIKKAGKGKNVFAASNSVFGIAYNK